MMARHKEETENERKSKCQREVKESWCTLTAMAVFFAFCYIRLGSYAHVRTTCHLFITASMYLYSLT